MFQKASAYAGLGLILVKRLALSVLVILACAYPFFVLMGIRHVSPAVMAAGLILLSIGKLLLSKRNTDARDMFFFTFLIIYSIFVAVTNRSWALLYYPVVMNFGMAMLFIMTLRDDESMIEKFARMAGKIITKNAKIYTRKLTCVWALILSINGLFAGMLAHYAPIKIWALYNGAVVYAVFALIFIGEFFYRQHYIKKYGE